MEIAFLLSVRSKIRLPSKVVLDLVYWEQCSEIETIPILMANPTPRILTKAKIKN